MHSGIKEIMLSRHFISFKLIGDGNLYFKVNLSYAFFVGSNSVLNFIICSLIFK